MPRSRVILGVLFILCITPIFDVRFFPAGDVNSFEVRSQVQLRPMQR